jgi:hypothetical protein
MRHENLNGGIKMKKLLAVLFAAMISTTMLMAGDKPAEKTEKSTVKKTHKTKKTTEEKKVEEKK